MDALPNAIAPAEGQGDLVQLQAELQKLLMDEVKQCEHHKTNYQTLKAEYTRLQNEYTRSQNEVKKLLHEKQTVHDKFQVLLAEFREELLDKTKEVEELKTQVITPQKLELLKAQIQHDIETPMRERIRKLDQEVEKHRAECNKLRYEHNFLKSEFEYQKEEHARILEESKLKYKTEVITPQKLELLKAQIQHDLEIPMRECFWKLDEKVEKYRAECSRLRYEHNFLKAEFEHQKEQHAHVLEVSKLKYETEIARLEKDKEDLRNQLLSAEHSRDSKGAEALLREEAQLVQKLKGLKATVMELRAQREDSGMQAENVQSLQGCLFAEMQAAARSLEAEKQPARLNLECAEKELLLSTEQNGVLTSQLHEAEQEISALTTEGEKQKLECVEKDLLLSHEQDGVLTGKLHEAEQEISALTTEGEKQSVKLLLSNEQNAVLTSKLHEAEQEISALTTEAEVKHSNKVEITDMKLEAAQARSEIERESNKFQTEIDELRSDNEILKTTLELHKVLLVEKDRELGKVQAAKEEGLQNLAAFQEEKLKLDLRLAEMEKSKKEQDCEWQLVTEQYEKEISALQSSEETHRREIQNLRLVLEIKLAEMEKNKIDRYYERQLTKEHYEKEITALQLAEEFSRREIQNLRLQLQQQVINSEPVEKEKSDTANPKEHIQDPQLGVASLSQSENDLLDPSQKCQEIMGRFRNVCQNARSQAERTEINAERKTLNGSKQKKLLTKIELLEAKKEELEIEKNRC